MAALLSPSPSLPPLNNKVNPVSVSTIAANTLPTKNFQPIVRNGRINRYHWLTKAKMSAEADVLAQDSVNVESIDANDYGIVSMHHVGILCENLERSLDFYQNVLGLKINEARPDDKLPYRGAWLWVGSEMIHLMELPNPDPLTGRPQHGGRDRHTCVAIQDVSRLKVILDKAGIPYTLSRSGRPAIFFRDRHTCVAIQDVSRLKAILDKAGIPYTLSRSGRPAIFFRDPDANALEFAEFDI